MTLTDMKNRIESYHTSKILSGRGLEDNPEWIEKFQECIDRHERELL
jgi:hypothetical protein